MARLELRPRGADETLRPVVLNDFRGDAGRFRRQQRPRVQQAQGELVLLGLVGGPVGSGKALGRAVEAHGDGCMTATTATG